MSDAARLAKMRFAGKAAGAPYPKFSLTGIHRDEIRGELANAAAESAFAAAVTYVEAMAGIKAGTIAWSVVRLYYTCYYCLKALAVRNGAVPFNSGKEEMIYNAIENAFLKGGSSSHHWNWSAMRRVPALKSLWFYSEDSENAYAELRSHREDVNYRHAFPDPEFHNCLASHTSELDKRIREYRDDAAFFYTYLADHLALAYPTKMIFHLEQEMLSSGFSLDCDKKAHLKGMWKMKDRCPFAG
ncbi:hypothetical protein [Rhizobium mayense]|uniref:HEPN domain-containing protein n=1 Tax=Rhizobium mayense TaxID=1312184 RepID=A0ABT7JSY4_9HYPH|nr:hypothetical protein [Rhizobium mayense]MDL2399463.1 hypothetical protein [Rhizobium mayense]